MPTLSSHTANVRPRSRPPKAQGAGSLTHVRTGSRFQALEWFDGKQLVAPCKTYLWCSDEPKVVGSSRRRGAARRGWRCALPCCPAWLRAAVHRDCSASPSQYCESSLPHLPCTALSGVLSAVLNRALGVARRGPILTPVCLRAVRR